ncbi:NosD domain-containing protein [Archangium violaceum]|uniref:right-handed parallel beta-helix repeat-containing protein n=1 Tax=Archangium violaceum TaxID=83451 RepID=UPI002B2DEAC0|nr:NosD domain-containing protein [Archangium gephyra]
MNVRSPLCAPVVVGLLLAGCAEPLSGEAPPDPVPVPISLRVPVPEGLRDSGAVLLVSRLHASRPAQEFVTALPSGSQEFEVGATPGEVLAVSLLDSAGALSESAMVQAGVSSVWPAKQAQPRILRVPQDYQRIQAAVDAARAGDTVLVKSGTYFETVRLKSGIQLLGSGARWTILDGGGAPVKLIDFSGASDVVVAGFTFQNVGTGNLCDAMDVMDCGGDWYSAAVYADGHTDQGEAPTSALLMHNVFRNNSIGAMLYFHARAVVRNNLFVGNTHGFVANHFQDVALVANNVFWENTREAIVSQAAWLDILNNVVVRSEIGIWHAHIQTGRIRCNLFFENGVNGADIHLVPPRFEIGTDGNVELDPLFVSPEAGNFHPAGDSPLIDAGCFEGLEQNGTREDRGAYGGPLGNWQ